LGSLPEFLAATFLAFVFAVWLRILPVAGANSAQALVLPALAVSIRSTAILTRIVRVETLNTLASDFIRTARGKRIPDRIIYSRHTLPNVVTAALTVGGLLFAGIIGGAVLAPATLMDLAPNLDLRSASQQPSAAHLLGTDTLGRDILARLFVATRLSMGLAFASAVLGALIGMTFGVGAVVLQGRARSV